MPAPMAARLLASPGVVEKVHLGGEVGVLALHGRLEKRTEWLAEVVATSTGASLYTVTLPPDLWWHVPSTRFGEAPSPRLTAFLGRVRQVVSIHGYGRPGLEHSVLLGGRNRRLAGVVATHVRATGLLTPVDDLEAIPRRLRGMAPANPVNLPPEAGVQVEVPGGARSGRRFDALAEALVAAVGGQSPGN